MRETEAEAETRTSPDETQKAHEDKLGESAGNLAVSTLLMMGSISAHRE